MLKSPNEIAAIRKAISFTNTGLKAMLTQLKPEMFEYQARALFEYVIGDRHNAKLAFATIAASGVNATILHYPTPNERMKDGQLYCLILARQMNCIHQIFLVLIRLVANSMDCKKQFMKLC